MRGRPFIGLFQWEKFYPLHILLFCERSSFSSLLRHPLAQATSFDNKVWRHWILQGSQLGLVNPRKVLNSSENGDIISLYQSPLMECKRASPGETSQ
jgi:hypothetical protein